MLRQREKGLNFNPKPKPKFDEKRDLLLDVISKDKEVQIVMEIPGVSKKDIKVRGAEKQITVVVDALKDKYYKKIKMNQILFGGILKKSTVHLLSLFLVKIILKE